MRQLAVIISRTGATIRRLTNRLRITATRNEAKTARVRPVLTVWRKVAN